ncbi:GDP-L-fucose synthase [Candidatus Nanopelagicus limnes]|uniref:GDP-L-fucose synthase n=1 Tax=Candidatus Nanopelagicus limnae TaxID=1884634 RepID=A0A249JZ91_9ACTN|nr:GDP-L-fucose synthase [Candidatus Nanopelagicus limnes]ASY09863.1 GDP-L-fucose synthase [Candidatus Nanopelagicus limnes]
MTILVAGGSGLVGSAIVRELKRLNQVVVGISSKDVDLLDRDKTFEFTSNLKPTAIIDCAAKVGGIGGNNSYPVEFLSQNLQIQSNLMDAAHAAKVSKFVFLGSSCIYPRDCAQPIKEEYLLTGELEQTNSAYAVAKIAGIELIKSYRKEYGYKWISVMPTNMYGPNDNFDLENGHVLPVLIRKFIEAKRSGSGKVILWGSGSPLREFLHVDDLAKAVLLCMDKYDDSKQINVGSGQEVSIKDLADKISKAVGFNGEISWDSSKPDGTMRKVLDSSKIANLGWKPLISLDQGIASTVEWYLQNK